MNLTAQIVTAAVIIAVAVFAIPRSFSRARPPQRADASIEEYYRGIIDIVIAHGWACQVVGSAGQADFGYTIGLAGKGLPDLLFNGGGDPNVITTILNTVADWLIADVERARDGAEPLPGVHLRNIYPGEFFSRCTVAALWNERHFIKSATGMQVVVDDP